jgi:hypothetical protein
VRFKAITIAVAALAVILPAAAHAQSSGNSGLDQYQESLPGAGGDRPTGGGSGGGSSTGGSSQAGGNAVSPATDEALKHLGPDGKQAAGFANATAPAKAAHPGGTSNGGSGARTAAASTDTDDGPDMGWVLPAILALSAAAALVVAFLRFRRGTPPGAA